MRHTKTTPCLTPTYYSVSAPQKSAVKGTPTQTLLAACPEHPHLPRTLGPHFPMTHNFPSSDFTIRP